MLGEIFYYNLVPPRGDLFAGLALGHWECISNVLVVVYSEMARQAPACSSDRFLRFLEIFTFIIVREKVGKFAAPDVIHNAPGLPKTRSGKIMRRVLRKIAVNDHELGDISTMADASVVEQLFSIKPIKL